MFTFKTLMPLLNFPLAVFPIEVGRPTDLYDIRVKATRKEGWFLVNCTNNDFAASFDLIGDHAGKYMLGRIVQAPSVLTDGPMRYEMFIHGGSKDASAFCLDEIELLKVIQGIEFSGMDYVITRPDVFEPAMEERFIDYFDSFPGDLRFEMLFSEHSKSGSPVHDFTGF